MDESFTDLCRRLEHFETPEWAATSILDKETLPGYVIDPCAGSGVLCEALRGGHYLDVWAQDIQDWGYKYDLIGDFLSLRVKPFNSFSVFMNPPFSKACEFVEKSFELGARKIVCFQRFAWWESRKRREFWERCPPNRIYICGDRAHCWRHDIPEDQRTSSTPTAHAWFVWEDGSPPGTLLGHIWRDK